MKKIACIMSTVAVLVIIYGAGSIQGYFQDTARATSNTFTAYSSTIWTQTTRADFNAGSKTNVNVDTIPGDVILGTNAGHYRLNGNLRSQVFNTGRQGSKIDLLYWDAILPPQTTITFYVRASNTSFTMTAGSPAWINVGTMSPVSAGLPKGQYIQWRANLATSNNAVTPDLKEVQVWYH
jgi:hypothetical protein